MKTLITMLTLFSGVFCSATELTVRVKSLRSDAGNLLLSVYNSADGFPDQPEKAVRLKRIPAQSGEMSVDFEGLAAGEYAVVFVHDENSNGELDLNDFNIPKEGLGFSNDPRLTFGPPSFNQAKFRLEGASKTISPTMKYY